MTADEQTSASPRRRFLVWLARGFLSLWAVGFAWVVAGFVKAPRSRRSLAERVIKIGAVSEFPVGSARLVRHGREPIFVVRTGEDTLVGLSAVCTHLHCILTWNEADGVLRCPCHDGAFDLNGNVLHGPPPRPLQKYRVDTQLGEIYVHL